MSTEERLFHTLNGIAKAQDSLPSLKDRVDELRSALSGNEFLSLKNVTEFRELDKASKDLADAQKSVEALGGILKNTIGNSAFEYLAETGKDFIVRGPDNDKWYRLVAHRGGTATMYRN